MCAAPGIPFDQVIAFRQTGDILYPDYKLNYSALKQLEATIVRHRDSIIADKGHIRLVAFVTPDEKNDPAAINMAATRAAVLRTHLRNMNGWLEKSRFAFYICIDAPAANSVQVGYRSGPVPDDAPADIYYSVHKDNTDAIRVMLSKYGSLPLIPSRQDPGKTAKLLPTAPIQPGKDTTTVSIHYRWDKSTLDSLYMSNAYNLRRLDSILVSEGARSLDTLTISAFASPEGSQDYNMRLSERRAVTLKDYIEVRYPDIEISKIKTVAHGENWEGLERLAAGDANLPSRDKVLSILRSNMNEEQKQDALTRLDGGTTYYSYILPKYYKYLRMGAMVLMDFVPNVYSEPVAAGKPLAVSYPVSLPEPQLSMRQLPVQQLPVQQLPAAQPSGSASSSQQEFFAGYPLALKTNLLYDLVGAANLGVEVPFGGRWSAVGDAAYAYWHTSNNLYALQTLEYGLSVRYWLPVSNARKTRNQEWAKPLRGWNFGVYGRYWQRYDVQWLDGCQGDGSWSVGVTAAYAFPIGRNLSLEAGLGAGYFSTSQYRTYDRPLYDNEGNYHLMWRKTGRWSGLTLTKVNFSFVWLIETKKGGGR